MAALRNARLLLSAHPEGMVPPDIGNELDMPPSSLSHHLDLRIRRVPKKPVIVAPGCVMEMCK
jgi:hypothetical protein